MGAPISTAPGQAHDLQGVDALLPQIAASTLLAAIYAAASVTLLNW